jgi:hypothetical protein
LKYIYENPRKNFYTIASQKFQNLGATSSEESDASPRLKTVELNINFKN